MNGDNEYGTKRLQAICIIMSTDSYQYSGIWNNLKNSTLLGTDNYPKTTTSAYYVLFRYKKLAPQRQLHVPPTAVTFCQSGDTKKNKITPWNDGRYFPEVTCYCCQETGYYAGNFSSFTAIIRTGIQSLQVGLTMTQTTKEEPKNNIINQNWILLDTCSTISSIRNKSLVQNIHPCDVGKELRAYTNG